jgi:hypothetical protein
MLGLTIATVASKDAGGLLQGKILGKRYVVLEPVGEDGDAFRYLVYDMNSLARTHARVFDENEEQYEIVPADQPLAAKREAMPAEGPAGSVSEAAANKAPVNEAMAANEATAPSPIKPTSTLGYFEKGEPIPRSGPEKQLPPRPAAVAQTSLSSETARVPSARAPSGPAAQPPLMGPPTPAAVAPQQQDPIVVQSTQVEDQHDTEQAPVPSFPIAGSPTQTPETTVVAPVVAPVATPATAEQAAPAAPVAPVATPAPVAPVATPAPVAPVATPVPAVTSARVATPVTESPEATPAPMSAQTPAPAALAPVPSPVSRLVSNVFAMAAAQTTPVVTPDGRRLTQPLEATEIEIIPADRPGGRPRVRTKEIEAAWFAQGNQLGESEPVPEEDLEASDVSHGELVEAARNLSSEEYQRFALELTPPQIPLPDAIHAKNQSPESFSLGPSATPPTAEPPPPQQAPPQQAPLQQAPPQQAPPQQAPLQQAPLQQAPLQQAPLQRPPHPVDARSEAASAGVDTPAAQVARAAQAPDVNTQPPDIDTSSVDEDAQSVALKTHEDAQPAFMAPQPSSKPVETPAAVASLPQAQLQPTHTASTEPSNGSTAGSAVSASADVTLAQMIAAPVPSPYVAPVPATHPSIADPSVADPSVADPSVADPSVADPSVADPSVADPSVADPSVADPSVADPSVADPSVADPSVADPSVADPSVADPSVADPSVADPSVADPPIAALSVDARPKTAVTAPTKPEAHEQPKPSAVRKLFWSSPARSFALGAGCGLLFGLLLGFAFSGSSAPQTTPSKSNANSQESLSTAKAAGDSAKSDTKSIDAKSTDAKKTSSKSTKIGKKVVSARLRRLSRKFERKGFKQFKRGRYAQALVLALRAIKLDPANDRARRLHRLAMVRLGLTQKP